MDRVKKEYDTLRRRPFLTPIWLMGVAAFVVLAIAVWVWANDTSTIVVLVRHAEKQLNAGDDPHLTPVGEARAELLARLFGNGSPLGRLDAIYVSPTLRSHETAAPLAKKLGIKVAEGPEDDPPLLSSRVLHEHPGGRVLIVGHSNTVPALVARLSGTKSVPEIGDDDYGTLYVVVVPRIGRANVLRMTY